MGVRRIMEYHDPTQNEPSKVSDNQFYIALVNEEPTKQGKKKKVSTFSKIVIAAVVSASLFFSEYQFDALSRSIYEGQNDLIGSVATLSGSYFGDTDFGVFTGEGRFVFRTGEEYSGVWDNDALTGVSTAVYPEKGTYQGEFEGLLKSGTGRYDWNNGNSYTGEWSNDTINGQGVLSFADGSVLTGRFENNIFIDGTYTYTQNDVEYEITFQDSESKTAVIHFTDGTSYSGDFLGNDLSGTGTMNFANGDCYEGGFLSGARENSGTYTWADGEYYTGQWHNDVIDGQGVYVFANGSSCDGSFKDGCFVSGDYKTTINNKEATVTYSSKKVEEVNIWLKNGSHYYGGVSAGTPSGNGTLEYSSGDKYIGDFANGKKSGDGVYTWASGARYDGKWKNDMMNGKGTYYYPPNSKAIKVDGSFESNQPTGTCWVYTSSDSYKTDWKNGRCVKIYE